MSLAITFCKNEEKNQGMNDLIKPKTKKPLCFEITQFLGEGSGKAISGRLKKQNKYV